MRLIYILVVMVVATLHSYATASPSVKTSKAAIKTGAVPGVVDSNLEEGGRILRRVDSDYNDLDDDDLDGLDDDSEEERGLGDSLKKLNPATAVKKSLKKSTEHSEKIKQAMKDAADYQKMIEKAREIVNKN